MHLQTLVTCLCGFAAGFVDAIAGGGGVIVFPALILANIPAEYLLGTNKLVGATGTTMAVVSFARGGKVDRSLARFAVPLAAIGSCLGVGCAAMIPTALLKPFAAAMTVALAFYFFLRPKLGISATFTTLTPRLKILLGAGALAIGFYDGIFGPGTGAFLTFLFVRIIGLDFVSAAANTKVLNLTSNLVALALFVSSGAVLFSVGLPMAACSMLGGYAGAHCAMRRGAELVRWLFLIMAVAVVAKLLLA